MNSGGGDPHGPRASDGARPRRSKGGCAAMNQAEIVASALLDPAALAADLGGDVDALMSDAALPPRLAPGGPKAVPLSRFVAFSQLAAERLGVRDFGWRAGLRFDPANLGEIGRVASSAPTLGHALTLMRDAFAAVQGASELRLSVEDGEAALSYRILDPDIWPREQDAALTLGVLARLVTGAAGDGRALLQIALEAGAAPGGIVDAPCPVVAGGPCNALIFPSRLLDRPMPGGDADGYRALSRRVRAHARDAAAAAPLEQRVRGLILLRLGADGADQAAIARTLGMSRRTLRRRLEDQGTGFAEILADCRERSARMMLTRTALPIAEIAAALGYSDQSAFERAYRRRTGVTPAAWRRAALSDG